MHLQKMCLSELMVNIYALHRDLFNPIISQFIEMLALKETNKKEKIGLMLSYGGENRKVPARYRAYDLSSVFRIIKG